ncbi:hypothetical protein HMPREF9447_03966 [Bacteroides oleiciplenus YIT 12058]|uniref:Uncharacterized protein n=2 Tax=Bacteroides oleiciplenus TaxID=626931 RepID=K9EDR4_9BACE|nr:hypothetical protein HMPREF9447_03966 [Bacteroides oleiciplenus YIT 12058]
MPSDEDLYACLCFRGANLGNVFITTKLYSEFIFLFGLFFLSPRTRSISSPYLLRIYTTEFATDLVRT